MLKTVPFVLATGLLATIPVHAQRGAPVSQGATTTDLAMTTSRLQGTTADLQVRVDELQAENARLNGKIETLEFLLGQTRDEINRMQGDDQEIGRLLASIQRRLEEQGRKLAALEARPLAPAGTPAASGAVTIGNSGAQTGETVTDVATAAAGPRTVTRATGVADAATATAPEAETALEAAPAQTGSLGTLPASALPGEAGPLFAEAKSKLLQFDYAGAEQAFRAFLDQFGGDPQAGEALYWLGEVLYQQDAFAESGGAYTEMIRTYPNDPRTPDALVKLARSLRLVGEADKACAALDALPNRYPNASGVTKNLAAVERSRSACDS